MILSKIFKTFQSISNNGHEIYLTQLLWFDVLSIDFTDNIKQNKYSAFVSK